MKKDKKHGYGIEYSSTGNVVYEGEWDYGERHGKGSYCPFYLKLLKSWKRDISSYSFSIYMNLGILFSLEEGDGSKEYEGDWEDGLKFLFFFINSVCDLMVSLK